MKCKCGSEIHPKRFEFGYKTCIKCSYDVRKSVIQLSTHKTGNEIQIVKDPEVAAEFMAKTARVGFGTMRGISGGYKQRKVSQPRKPKEVENKIPETRELDRKPLPHFFESVGEEVMEILEKGSCEQAYNHIQKALEEKRIFGNHAKQLQEIVNILAKT